MLGEGKEGNVHKTTQNERKYEKRRKRNRDRVRKREIEVKRSDIVLG